MKVLALACLRLAAGLMLLSGCARDDGKRPPDVFLLVADALRADHVAEGRATGLTPTLHSLALRGIVFQNARAQCSWTMPSVASLLTSRLPSQHGVVFYRSRLREGEVTLPEVLHEAGYETAGFSANFLLSSTSGMTQGFSRFVGFGDSEGQKLRVGDKPSAAQLDRALLEWIDQMPLASGERAPVFAYLHYMETHWPAAPKPDALERVLRARGRSAEERARLAKVTFDPKSIPLAEAAAALEDLYMATLVTLDDELAGLFEQLAKRHLLDNAVVVLTADHGEEFYEHGAMWHGTTLYDEVLRIPLIMALPGGAGGAREVAGTVSSLDIAPTILSLAGIAIPPSFEGKSMLPMMHPSLTDRLRARACSLTGLACGASSDSFAELLHVPRASLDLQHTAPAEEKPHHQRSVVRGDAKAVRLSDGSLQTYDLGHDPGEKSPGKLPSPAAEALVGAMTKIGGAATAVPTQGGFDAETRERLRALGYEVDQ